MFLQFELSNDDLQAPAAAEAAHRRGLTGPNVTPAKAGVQKPFPVHDAKKQGGSLDTRLRGYDNLQRKRAQHQEPALKAVVTNARSLRTIPALSGLQQKERSHAKFH